MKDIFGMPIIPKWEDLSEKQLVFIAETDKIDYRAEKAMKILREKYDKTYGWCMDCDGLVIKEKDCCLNQIQP